MKQLWAVILAAGQGTRMNSSRPKVLHLLCGKPLLWHVLRSARGITDKQILIVGHGAEDIKAYFGEKLCYVDQEQQLGTGHALQQALPYLPDQGEILVLCGDTPLLEERVLGGFIDEHRRHQAAASILTAILEQPTGYGRVLRDEAGNVLKIVEELHATEQQKEIKEINTGSYCFDLQLLRQYLPLLPKNTIKGEYYLTDLVAMLSQAGHLVQGYLLEDANFALGINDRVQLAWAASCLRERINTRLMSSGVTMIDPATTYIDVEVEVGRDTIIYPQTVLEGKTKIGENCVLGPGVHLIDTEVGDNVICRQSTVLQSRLGNNCLVGPYAHIRPGSTIGSGVKIGDFVEIKNSRIGHKSRIPHLSYVGDAVIADDVNMGAGSIIVNYDGRQKHLTTIEEGAFVGCNSNLVAPLTIGKKSFIAAGSTITRDVPPGALAISRSRQKTKERIGERFIAKKSDK
ncbi:MAG: bifunctional UDP-N-acetylglucosamine diphosphorylase/glucosamine-1-phosphate N-acetyltransferase GlmU [Dethiobacteria bacterium]|jgi:bifunctional UDP-N-acetylglucosamine pyrophosphorylase/glucosamine-1-phosphate N-acetyltransferase